MKTEKQAITLKTGQRIKEIRTLKKMSQEDLALAAGINPSYIGHIERGLKCPTIDTLNRICAVLDITLSRFFDFDSETNLTDNSKNIELISRNLSGISQEKSEKITKIIVDIIKLASN